MSRGTTNPAASAASAGGLARLLALVAALLAAAGVSGVFFGPTPVALKLLALGVMAMAAWRTGDALVILAGLGPLGGALGALGGLTTWTTPLALALVAGAAWRGAIRPQAVSDRPARRAAAAWVAIVLASVATQLWLRAMLDTTPGAALHDFLRWLLVRYPAVDASLYAFGAAALMTAAGAALFAITASACLREAGLSGRITRALVTSGAAVGALAVYRLIEVALRHPPFLHSLARFERTLRVSPVVSDVNAVSAIFLLLLPAAIGLAASRSGRAFGLAALPGLLAGLWLAGSRTAMALVPVAVAAQSWPWISRHARVVRYTISGLAVLAAAAGGALLFLSRSAAHGKAMAAVIIREDLVTTTMGMVRQHPIFGIGIGEYYRRSPEFMPARLFTYYPAQNAHNQFLQVLGELGVTGLIVFCALLWIAIAAGARAVGRGRATPALRGLLVGALAFLTVSLGMHPLLVAEASVAFFLLLGVLRAEGVSALAEAAGAPSRRWTHVAVVVAVLACAAVPWRAWSLQRGADLEGVGYGFSGWKQAGDRLWRTSPLPAVIFVPASADRVTLPLRLRAPAGTAAPAVQVWIDGELADAIRLPNGAWTESGFPMPRTAAGRFRRMEFRWAGDPPPAARVDVGRQIARSGGAR